jgi:CRP-like cAMP-binding protein
MVEASLNHLLNSLPVATRRQCLDAAEKLDFRFGEEIATQGDRAKYVYFPTSAVCSLTVGIQSGDKAECAIVGAEGVIGVSLVGGASRNAFTAVVQVGGSGYRIPLGRFTELMDEHRTLRDAMLAYAGFVLNVVGRSVACNSYHSIIERFARWLLTMHDRVERDELALTHDMLSQMLTATRPRVSLTAAKLRGMKIIDYRRRMIRILDRKRLEQLSCECYEANRRYLQLLPWAPGEPR